MITLAAAHLAMNLLADGDQSVPIVVLGLGGIVVMYVVLRPMMKRKNDPFAKPFTSTSLSQQRSVERQMETLLVELSEMSRQMTSQLDTRAAKLEALISEADAKITQLQTLAKQAPPTPMQKFAMPAAESETPKPIFTPAPEPVAPPLPAQEPEVIPEAHAAVYRLADEGKTLPQIAAELRRPSGEIELILALRSR